MRRLGTLIVLGTLLAAGAAAGLDFPTDSFRRARVRALEAPGHLESEIRSLVSRLEQPAWIAYTVPRAPSSLGVRMHYRDGQAEGCGTYFLEENDGYQNREGDGAETLFVLLRASGGAVHKIRALSTSCDVDAGGLDVYALSSVDPRQSLETLVALAGGMRRYQQALHAIALHDEAMADNVLERVATGALDWHEEKQAVFWLGAARGERGFEILRSLIEREDDAGLRSHMTFGIYVSKHPRAVDLLIGMARHDEARRVRRQALFWLAQEAGRRAVGEIDRAAEEDPELEIKKYAVFALSQLPPDEGVPLLIRHARTHPNAAVRKKAFFWLGQSGDERALELLEEVLLE